MKIYTSKNCKSCVMLKQYLLKFKVEFEEIDGTTTKSVAYLRARKVPLQLPIIEDDNKFLTFDQYMESIYGEQEI